MTRFSSFARPVAAGLFLLLALSSCRQARQEIMDEIVIGSTEVPPVPSPDGKLLLTTTIERSHADPVEFGCVIFTITDSAGKVLHRENTHASTFQKWDMTWKSDREVVLKSSDIGNYRWVRKKGGSWKKIEPS